MQTIFERSEKKYLLTKRQCMLFYQAIQPHVSFDTYDNYTIYNLYYDTDKYDLIRNSIEKPPYKEKLRIRCYEQPKSNTPVFVELKKKYDKTVFKRRVTCTLEEANALILDHKPLLNQTQIVNEILYFLNFYQPVPKLFLSYERRALKGIEDISLRITFDTNIQYRNDHLDLCCQIENKTYLDHRSILMEIKSKDAFPLWLVHILSSLNLYPISFSKYGRIYMDCLFPTQRKEILHV